MGFDKLNVKPGHLYVVDCLFYSFENDDADFSVFHPGEIVMITKTVPSKEKETSTLANSIFSFNTSRSAVYFLHTPKDKDYTKERKVGAKKFHQYFSRVKQFKQ